MAHLQAILLLQAAAVVGAAAQVLLMVVAVGLAVAHQIIMLVLHPALEHQVKAIAVALLLVMVVVEAVLGQSVLIPQVRYPAMVVQELQVLYLAQ